MDKPDLHETKIHGSPAFPFSIYHGRIPEWIPSFPLHWHESFELIYCGRGSLRATVWAKAYTLCAGDMLVILPQAVHSIEPAGTAKGEYFNIIFAPSLFQGPEGDPCYDSNSHLYVILTNHIDKMGSYNEYMNHMLPGMQELGLYYYSRFKS